MERVAMIPVDGKEGPPDVCIIELGGTIGKNKPKRTTSKFSISLFASYVYLNREIFVFPRR